MNADAFAQTCGAIREQVQRVLLGQEEVVEQVLSAILAGGHALIEGVPGLGKTLLVRSLSRVLGCTTNRIQFTPDLMPSDVTGGNVYDQRSASFSFQPGPVFSNLLLADEINRAPAKTQSSLLEAMQERTVSADGQTRPLPQPFFVLATQNPVESQGTYPLPEAQLDRFLVKVMVDYPSPAVEKQLLQSYVAGFDANDLQSVGLQEVVSAEQVVALQAVAREVKVDDDVLEYITDIVGRTRRHRWIELGASPRASVALLKLARVRAAMEGRDFVVPDDVKAQGPAVLRHRVMLHPDAEFEGISADACVDAVLAEAKVPQNAA